MNVLSSDYRFPGFDYPSDKLLKFIAAGEIFTIQLTTYEIIHHEVSNPQLFRQWLLDNNIEDIK